MSELYEIVATPVFKITLRKLCNFLSMKYGAEIASQTRQTIRQRVSLLPENPNLGLVSDRLEALGFSDYRQLSIDTHNIVYYRVNTVLDKIILVGVIDPRQSIEKLLYEVTIAL